MIWRGTANPIRRSNKEWWKEEYTLTADHYMNFIITLCDALGTGASRSSWGRPSAATWRCNWRCIIPTGSVR